MQRLFIRRKLSHPAFTGCLPTYMIPVNVSDQSVKFYCNRTILDQVLSALLSDKKEKSIEVTRENVRNKRWANVRKKRSTRENVRDGNTVNIRNKRQWQWNHDLTLEEYHKEWKKEMEVKNRENKKRMMELTKLRKKQEEAEAKRLREGKAEVARNKARVLANCKRIADEDKKKGKKPTCDPEKIKNKWKKAEEEARKEKELWKNGRKKRSTRENERDGNTVNIRNKRQWQWTHKMTGDQREWLKDQRHNKYRDDKFRKKRSADKTPVRMVLKPAPKRPIAILFPKHKSTTIVVNPVHKDVKSGAKQPMVLVKEGPEIKRTDTVKVTMPKKK